VEITREVARRFNHLYGREPGFDAKAEALLKKLSKTDAKTFQAARKAFRQEGDEQALAAGLAIAEQSGSLSAIDKETLAGWLRGTGRAVLVEPQALHTEVKKLPGLDGAKMSKSYGNAIAMRDAPEVVTKKVRGMTTDPARVRRTDPGNPLVCPVWQFHLVYSDEPTREWVMQGCTTAGIGCLDCKQPVIEAINAELKPIRERADELEEDPTLVRNIIQDGCEKASDLADETMRDVRDAMGLNYA
jgi:tryptophanyl-tRNA synthetase